MYFNTTEVIISAVDDREYLVILLFVTQSMDM